MNVLTDYLAELVMAQFEARKPEPVPEQVTLDELYTIAVKGHMDYLILGSLLKLDNIPEEWKNRFRQRVFLSITKTVVQVNELKELRKRCEENQIMNQPMKGSWMKFIYPSPEMREMSDIDILIRGESMDAAVVQLKDMGYSLKEAIKHHDIYIKEPYMVIEAHRAMYDKTVDTNQFIYFSDFSRAVLVDGCKYTYNFNDEDFYVYLISHMAKHFYTMGCGIRNIVDIYVYLNAKGDKMDREYVDGELKKLGLYAFTKQMEELAYIWLGKKEGTEFQQQIFDYMVDGGIYGKDENGIWNRFSEEKLKDKDVSRATLCRWYFFPPMSYMCEYYPWLEDHAYLYPVAWCIRACRGVFMHKGREKREMLRDIDQDKVKTCQKIYQAMELHFK